MNAFYILICTYYSQFSCNMCNKPYTNWGSLWQHKISAHKRVRYSCDQCNSGGSQNDEKKIAEFLLCRNINAENFIFYNIKKIVIFLKFVIFYISQKNNMSFFCIFSILYFINFNSIITWWYTRQPLTISFQPIALFSMCDFFKTLAILLIAS